MPEHEARAREASSKPVPKFSFKPKPAQVAQRTEQPNNAEDPKSIHGSERRREPQPSAATAPPPSVRSQQPPSRTRHQDELYAVDKRGDPLIRRYGTNNAREIPEYHRFGAGRVLGADGFVRFERSGTRSEFFFRGYRDKGPILSSDRKTFRAMTGSALSHPIRVRQQQHARDTSHSAEYLPLRTSRTESDAIDQSQSSSRDRNHDAPAYRSIHGTRSDDMDDDESDHQSNESESEVQGHARDPTTLRSIELNRRVRDDPRDMDAWHDLVDHQNVLLRQTARDAQHPTAAEIRSFADIKLSLLERAMAHADTPGQREMLQLKIMAEGVKVWDKETITRRWHEVLQNHPQSYKLWQSHLAFRQADISTFQYGEIKQRYVGRIRGISKAVAETRPGAEQNQLCCQLICTILHATIFMSDAGYTELACSIWQAALEMTFRRPSSDAGDDIVALQPLFRAFWESEVARFGEPGSAGWAAFARDPAQAEPPEPKDDAPWSPPSTRDAYKAWAATERCKSQNAAAPARTLDGGAEADPFRVVLYNDIEEFLLWIPSTVIPAVKGVFFNALLAFCHLPALNALEELGGQSWDLPFRSSTGFHLGDYHESKIGHTDETTQRPPDFEQHFQALVMTPQILFGSQDWFQYLKKAADQTLQYRHIWALGTVKQLVRQVGELQLAPYYFALNTMYSSEDDKKVAKALLKQNPTNIDLYVGYSMREYVKGDETAARNIASAALSLPSISEHDRIRLHNWLVLMKLENSHLPDAMQELLSLFEPTDGKQSGAAPTSDLAARVASFRHSIASKRDYMVSAGNLKHAVDYSKSLVLLEYLTGNSNQEPASSRQGDIWSAMKSVTVFSDELRLRDMLAMAEHEAFLQFAAYLLYFHATHGPIRLGLLRNVLTRCINDFPKNTIFQVLFSWRETRLGVEDRVRTKMDEIVSIPGLDTISTRAFIIQYEAQAGNANSTAAAFEHALDNNDHCKNHPQFWISYIRFCHSHAALRGKTKSVFYRAVQRCPWSKDVFMEAFTTLISDLDSSELKSVYNTMCEKELRIHEDMEEFVRIWKTEQREKRQRR